MRGYQIVVSTRKNKKYDVYKGGKYVVSFGDKRYQHYKDSTMLKHYSNLDHLDKVRLKNFRTRFGGMDRTDKTKALYWSWHYLW